jgi:5'-nucleotidase
VLALVTNDDGIDSPGLIRLASAANHAGFDVIVAAPSWNSSGASASLTAVEQEGRFLIADVPLAGVDGRCISVEAAPAFIVRAALHGSFGPVPEVVLSGINRGLNCGHSVLHSGTVGAASTACTYDTPAVAFSVDSGRVPQWDTARSIATMVLRWFIHKRPSVLLNVNVPNVPLGQVRGLRPATLAAFGAVTTSVTESGEGHVALEYRTADARADPGTDVALIADRYATFTELQPVCEAPSSEAASLATIMAGAPG